jgi:hypothetical protein
MLRYPKDKATGDFDYSKSPTFRVKLPYWDGTFKFEAFNVNGEIVFPKDDAKIMDVIPKSSDVKIILQCGGIWFAGGKFGITWKPFQVVVKPKRQLTSGVCHLTMTEKEVAKESKVEMVDSDEEDPEKEYAHIEVVVESPVESVEQDEPEIPVKGKKKVVKKGN